MGQEPGTSGTQLTEAQDPEELRREIEDTREELGDTVEALAAKTDVKARTKDKVEQTKASVRETKDEMLGKAREASPDGVVGAGSRVADKARSNPLPVAAAGALLTGFLIGRITKR